MDHIIDIPILGGPYFGAEIKYGYSKQNTIWNISVVPFFRQYTL